MPTIFFKTISNNLLGGVNVSAMGLDFESVAKELQALQQEKLIKEVSVSSVQVEKLEEGNLLSPTFPKNVVRFELSIKFDPKIFVAGGYE